MVTSTVLLTSCHRACGDLVPDAEPVDAVQPQLLTRDDAGLPLGELFPASGVRRRSCADRAEHRAWTCASSTGAPRPAAASERAAWHHRALTGRTRREPGADHRADALRPAPGDPRPLGRRSARSAAVATAGERPFGVYVHVPFCAVRCGYCDFNTYTADELGDGARRLAGDVRRGRDRRGPAGPPGARRPRPAGRHGVLRRRHADAAPPRTSADARRDPRRVRARAGRRGHHRGEPRHRRRRRDLAALRDGRFHPDLVRDAVGGAARARRPWTAPTTRARAGRRRLGARRRASSR